MTFTEELSINRYHSRAVLDQSRAATEKSYETTTGIGTMTFAEEGPRARAALFSVIQDGDPPLYPTSSHELLYSVTALGLVAPIDCKAGTASEK